jgi:hypothetical protein
VYLVGFVIKVGITSLVFVVCCAVSGLYEELIARSDVSYRARLRACVCVSV